MPHKPGNGAIFGIVSEDGVAKQGFPVTLLDRTTGNMVSRQTTDQNGGFVFNGLDPETDDYQVIGQDEDGEAYKNAVIRDRIRPVPAYQGATYHGNWRHLANEIGILACYEGQAGHNYLEDTLSGTVQDYPTMRAPIIRHSGNGSHGAVEKPALLGPMTPGDPSIPATLFQNQTMTAYARFNSPTVGNFGHRDNPAHTAIELVADFSALSSSTGWVNFITALAKGDYDEPNIKDDGSHVIGIFYNTSGKYISLQINHKGYYYHWRRSDRTHIGDVDMSSYQGEHHVIVSAAYGEKLEVFIDGVLVETLSMAGLAATQECATHNDNGYLGGIHVSAEYDSNYSTSKCRGITGPVSLITWYARGVNKDEAKRLYQALMIGSEPRLTGYMREVYVERPSFLVRMNDAAGTTEFSNMLGAPGYFGSGYGQLKFMQPSIVTGGNTIGFDGNAGILFDFDAPSLYNPFGLTAIFVSKPVVEFPSAHEYILKTTDKSDVFNHGIIISRTEIGTLRVYFMAGGTSEKLDFLTPMDHLDLHHYIISVDKKQRAATLYVDGEYVEDVSVSPLFIDRPQELRPAFARHQAMIGGSIANNGAITNGYTGLLGDMCVTQNPVSAIRAKQLFDSLSVA